VFVPPDTCGWRPVVGPFFVSFFFFTKNFPRGTSTLFHTRCGEPLVFPSLRGVMCPFEMFRPPGRFFFPGFPFGFLRRLVFFPLSLLQVAIRDEFVSEPPVLFLRHPPGLGAVVSLMFLLQFSFYFVFFGVEFSFITVLPFMYQWTGFCFFFFCSPSFFPSQISLTGVDQLFPCM